MKKNRDCPFCGYEIKQPDGFLANTGCSDEIPQDYQGKSAHVGCLRQWVINRRKTLKMLNEEE